MNKGIFAGYKFPKNVVFIFFLKRNFFQRIMCIRLKPENNSYLQR